jgi:formylglycine-generating enzyme required for sulfatase activity
MKTTWGYRAVVLMAVLLLSATLVHAQGTQLLVSNVQVQQRQFTALYDITYDLETVGDLPVWVSLILSMDGGATYPNLCTTVTGDVGAGVLPGTGKHIVWNAGTDFPGLNSATCRLRVTAGAGESEILAGFVAILPGTFTMGSPTNEPGRGSAETQHQVTLTHGLYVQSTEVTNQQYRDLAQWAYDHGYVTATSASIRDNLDGSTQILRTLGAESYEIYFNAGVFGCVNPDYPVKYVTWYGSVAYCDWLSLQQGLARAYSHSTWQCNGGNPYSAAGYRLPTEAEWEYACRAGSTTAFANGAFIYPYAMMCSPYDPIEPNLNLMGWYCGNAFGLTHPVAQKTPNAWGLYDMHGNLWEWCNDWSGPYGGTVTDPVGSGTGSTRVRRGGEWNYIALLCRSAQRIDDTPGSSGKTVGFRPVRSATETPALVYVAPGTFMMGSPPTEDGHDDFGDETQHQVTLTHGIYVQATEVTNRQYLQLAQWACDNGYARVSISLNDTLLVDLLDGSTEVLTRLGQVIAGNQISFSNGVFSCTAPDRPVAWITWYGSVAYCDWLSLAQRLPRAYSHATWQCNGGNPYAATGYRLPTEAEWEYACRAGTQTAFNTGACLDAYTEANYFGGAFYTGCPYGPSGVSTVPVGSYPANVFGLYDMHGNVTEWCNDLSEIHGGERMWRGGGWGSSPQRCRSADRGCGYPLSYMGFRPVRSAW